ncbi:MAG: Ig-like domain-containing protein [Sphingomonadales bacterium]
MRIPIILVLAAAVLAAGAFLMPNGGDPPDPTETVDAATAGAPATPVAFELVRLSREGMGVIAGSAAPGAFVDVMAEGRSIGKSRASEDGSWEVVLARSLEPGAHVLGLTATDSGGRETRSADVAVVAVPPPPDKGPDIKVAKGEKKPVLDDGVLAVMVPRRGGEPGRVLQRPGQLTPKLALGVDTADFDAAGRTVLGGRANAGNTVNVYLDGRPVGTAKADDEGRWSMVVASVKPSAHNIRLEEIDPGNAVVQNVSQAFDPSVTLAAQGDVKTAVLWPDKAVWHLVRRTAGGTLRYTQVFRPDQGIADDDKLKVPGVLKPGSNF